MSSFQLKIPFTPKAKGSIALTMGGKTSYSTSAKGMQRLRYYVRGAIQPESLPMLSGPLLVILHFQIPAPLSLSEYKRVEFERKNHDKRPAGYSLEKFVTDALSGVVWSDESQIAWCVRSKTYTGAKIGAITIFARELSDFANYKEILRDIKDNLEIR